MRHEIILATDALSCYDGEPDGLIEAIDSYSRIAVRQHRRNLKIRFVAVREGFNPSGEITETQCIQFYC